MRLVKEYVFLDSNIYVGKNEKYDILGEQYKDLIKKCCEYSAFFSLDITYGKPSFFDTLCEFEMIDMSFVP